MWSDISSLERICGRELLHRICDLGTTAPSVDAEPALDGRRVGDAHLSELPIVAFDETGNTGQNLLDAAQPVFVLASVHMPDDRAKELASAATPPASSEAKFGSLRTSKAGRKRILSLLREGQPTVDEVRIAVYHKSFMITTKVVDALVETWHHRMGVDFYENAANLGLANLLHTRDSCRLRRR